MLNHGFLWPFGSCQAVAGPVVKGPSVAMDITFDCPRHESERLLQQRLQLRCSAMWMLDLNVRCMALGFFHIMVIHMMEHVVVG